MIRQNMWTDTKINFKQNVMVMSLVNEFADLVNFCEGIAIMSIKADFLSSKLAQIDLV